MKRWLKSLKLMTGVVAVFAAFAAAPIVYGGHGWSGVDPVLEASGHTINVWVEWPDGMECTLTGPILFEIKGDAKLISESADTFACGDSSVAVETETTVVNLGLPLHIKIKEVFAPALESFPVRVKVYEDGVLVSTCEGQSNVIFACEEIKLSL